MPLDLLFHIAAQWFYTLVVVRPNAAERFSRIDENGCSAIPWNYTQKYD